MFKNPIILRHHHSNLIHLQKNKYGDSFFCVSVSCPDSDNGYGNICVSTKDCSSNFDNDDCYDIYLGDPDMYRTVSFLKNGKYIRRDYTNRQIEGYTMDYYHKHITRYTEEYEEDEPTLDDLLDGEDDHFNMSGSEPEIVEEEYYDDYIDDFYDDDD